MPFRVFDLGIGPMGKIMSMGKIMPMGKIMSNAPPWYIDKWRGAGCQNYKPFSIVLS